MPLPTPLADHRYIDLSFVSAKKSPEQACAEFRRSNSYLISNRSNFEKGLYQEMHSVSAYDDALSDDSSKSSEKALDVQHELHYPCIQALRTPTRALVRTSVS